MPREIALFGVLIPTLLPIFVVCCGLQWGIDRLLTRFGVYRMVMSPPFFRLCVFVTLFSSFGLIAYR